MKKKSLKKTVENEIEETGLDKIPDEDIPFVASALAKLIKEHSDVTKNQDNEIQKSNMP